jgi:hypothetical protein
MDTPERPNPYAVPLRSLEEDAHVAPEALVEELGEDPAPDLVPEERRRLESFLKYGTA